MHLKYLKTILDAQNQLSRIGGLTWAPNHQKLAVATADRSIILFDENGEKRDKFSTKPSGSVEGKTSYVIRALVFSPDSTSLAVAQSDNIVYVYKLGTTWKEKKVICNKFPQPTAVTVMVWLSVGPIIIGLEDGKVRALNCKTNRSQNLYAAEHTVVSLAANVRGTGFVSGHEDGSVIRFFIVDETKFPSGRLFVHTSSPLALAWAQNDIVAAGCDRKVIFYNVQGQQSRVFDYSHDDNEKEFTSAECSPNGQSIAIGNYDQIRIYTWSPRQKTWTDVAKKEIKNLYSVSAMTWRSDGARLVVGSICGAVLLFESVLKRTVWHDKFELTYVTHSQLLLKSLQESDSTVLVVESQLGLEIDDVRFMGKDNYLVAHTEDSLILCDLTRNLTSELSWISSGHNEKFYFENPNVCFIFNAGELTLVEYGENSTLGSVRTEFVNPHVISVRINERGNTRDNKKLAYLMDMKTISVVDLISQSIIAQINHESKIDWLELSETAHKILFRDKKMRLILFDIATSKKYNLMDKVSFVQWVPQSDVVVAQSDYNLAIWYNIDVPQHVTMVSIRGDVTHVVREEGTTEVKMKEGPTEHSYRLDQGLVEFGTAVNDNDFGKAIIFLESHDDKSAAKAMWHNLARIALYQQNMRVAQRCFVALGNASMAFYLGKTIKAAAEYGEEMPLGVQGNEVRARMALVNCDLKSAERIYLDQGNIDAAISVYTRLRLWDDAIKLAERRGYHGLNTLREQQMSFLLSTNQEELAGHALEESGDTDRAMTLYLKANKPVKAARLALKWPSLLQDNDLMNRVAKSLIAFELYELAGDLSNKLRKPEAAIEMYRRGGAYSRAIELARNVSPDEVTSLEEEWGDWLVSKRQMDASISHYIEAGSTIKALEAAVGAKQWRKAVQIAKVIDDPIEIRKYAVQLSDHLNLLGDKKGAEDILVRAELYKEAVEMLNQSGQWERAYVIAEQYLGSDIVRDMFIEMAAKLEQDGKYRDCERVFIAINEPDLAISMYERLEQYDPMIRLVERYHKDLLDSTHLHIAKQLEAKSKYKMAEGHYIAAGDWKAVVHMYCSIGKWEEAHRTALQKGTEDAANQVAYIWSRSLPLEGAARLLTKMNLIRTALLYACDAKQFEFALDLCRVTGHSSDDVHLRMAMDLEDEGKFFEAEAEFLLANKPKEAILMYSHSRDWRSALRVAEKYLPEAVNEILISQAAESLESQNYQEYEALLIRAERPDIVLQQYKESEMWPEAIRIAREYVPAALPDIQRLQARNSKTSAMISNDSRALLHHASEFIRSEEFKKAALCLLKINSINADPTTVEQALIRAAEICNQNLDGDDATEVAGELGPRLVELSQFGPAAQLYLAAEMPKEAVDVFIQSENWGKARRLAKEINPQLLTYVETQQKSRLRMENNVEQLADIDIIGALDLLAEQGQWTRCIEKAKQHSSVVMHKYLAQYATQLIRENECVEALSAYMKYGAPPLPQNFNIYNRIAVECIGLRETDGMNVWKDLRLFLFNLTQSIKMSDAVIDGLDRFEELLLIAHYYVTRAACREISSLKVLAVKISVALLRYTEIIPVDKGFYEAGMDLRSVGRESEAFVILNHYLDVSEAIDGSDVLVDHLNLTATDFPSSVPIPSELHLKDDLGLHEEVREWVLSVSMDQRVDQVLPIDERNLFESSLGMSDQPCVITGYPVVGKQPIIFQRSQRQANRDAWSKISVAAKMEPHSNIPDVIEFIEKWCGVANFVT